MSTTKLIDQEALDTAHTQDHKITLDLYPVVPLDIADWADQVFENEGAKANFLRLIGKEFHVNVLIDKSTGNFRVGGVTFYSTK